MPLSKPSSKPVVLCILDGFGVREAAPDNAIDQAKAPHWKTLWRDYPHTLLDASGGDVGLPEGQMGNSEVGHMNIGAGRVVYQDLPMINKAIETGELACQPALGDFITTLRAQGGTCHLMGLASPGGVHAHQDHMVVLARLLQQAGVPVRIHAFLDGRDVPPDSAAGQIADLQAAIRSLEGVSLATLCGRYYAMDRDKRWERVEKAYNLLVCAEGAKVPDPVEAIQASYVDGVYDEFVLPVVVGDYQGIKDGDGVLFANFRSDRAREILLALLDPAFDGFERKRKPCFSAALGMVDYSDRLKLLMSTLFPPKHIANGLGEMVAIAGLRQLRIAETEKYPHVTFFFNGGREEPYAGEDRVLVPSPKVATYDLQPEMSAPEVTDRVVAAIETQTYDLIVLNYANPDMVGHTGKLEAAIQAVEAVDAGIGRLVSAVMRVGGTILITADHGNCERMVDPETRGPHTAHTLSKVPFVLVSPPDQAKVGLARAGRLCDIAPTILELMGLAKPKEMNGKSLVV